MFLIHQLPRIPTPPLLLHPLLQHTRLGTKEDRDVKEGDEEEGDLELILVGKHGFRDGTGGESDADEGVDEVGRLATTTSEGRREEIGLEGDEGC